MTCEPLGSYGDEFRFGAVGQLCQYLGFNYFAALVDKPRRLGLFFGNVHA
jgi:hypothetical protein